MNRIAAHSKRSSTFRVTKPPSCSAPRAVLRFSPPPKTDCRFSNMRRPESSRRPSAVAARENPGCRRSGRAGHWAHARARARNRAPRSSGRKTDMNLDLRVRWLGRMNFADALALQEEIVAQKRADASSPDELLLLEHEPVYTIGRTPDQSSLLGASHLPYPLFPINRGGQATYHGPGQLMGYPIADLRRCGQDLHRYLRWLEEL